MVNNHHESAEFVLMLSPQPVEQPSLGVNHFKGQPHHHRDESEKVTIDIQIHLGVGAAHLCGDEIDVIDPMPEYLVDGVDLIAIVFVIVDELACNAKERYRYRCRQCRECRVRQCVFLPPSVCRGYGHHQSHQAAQCRP